MILKKEVTEADSFFPLDAAFFIIGGFRYLPVFNSERIFYQIDSNWLIRGLKGTDMQSVRIPKNKMTIRRLLIRNLEDVYNGFYKKYN